MPLKLYSLVVYLFIAVGAFFLFRLDASAQWILKTALILYIILLVLDGALQYFAHWVTINPDRFPGYKEALAKQELSDDQKRKYHLLQSLIAKKEQGEDISVESKAELNQLIDEFQIDENTASKDIDPDDLFDTLEDHPDLFEGMDGHINKKMRMLVVMYSVLIILAILLFFYVGGDSFRAILQ